MKKLFFLCFAFLLSTTAMMAQENPVKWTYRAEKINDKEFNLIAEMAIEEGWFVYSQYLASDNGPVRTSFDFSMNKNVELVGKNEESGDIKKMHDAVFEMDLIKFAHKGVFTQKIRLTNPTNEVKGIVRYMCCDEGMCLPPKEIPFSIKL